jgi:hypothetical protein
MSGRILSLHAGEGFNNNDPASVAIKSVSMEGVTPFVD